MNKATSKTKDNYKPQDIEPKWQQKWQETGIYEPDLSIAKRPFYNLFMFPYPSAEGMHVGNMFMQTGSDIYARFHRMNGFDTFQPTGLDGFGIHAENYALKIGANPMQHAQVTEENFYRQMKSTGPSFSWKHKLETYDIDYYRWTQWLFVQLFKAGLAYRAEAEVNWCPSCKTVLADEQVIDGKCERCNSEAEKKLLSQWFFRITAYADQLLEGLDKIDWTEKVKIAQRNWIGKSEGARIRFTIQDSGLKNNYIEVFTTRPDTLYGATFVVISPQHPLAQKIAKNNTEVDTYIKESEKKSEKERRESKQKSGVFSKAYAINPINHKQLPVWIADYVLMGYGTGAIMAVPAHDQRDFEFAKKYDLEIIPVVSGGEVTESAYAGPGRLINSEDWDGIKVPHGISEVIKDLEEKKIGEKETTYHLRDWLISRQRYWGPPIPMVYCEACAKKGLSWFDKDEVREKKIHYSGFRNHESATWAAGWYPEEKLPVELPYIDDYKPLGTGKSPLGNHPEFYETVCPHCGGKARRETDVSDTFLDSAWYFLRYLATDLSSIPFPMIEAAAEHVIEGSRDNNRDSSPAKRVQNDSQKNIGNWKLEIGNSAKRVPWLPVTQYIGGAEHSVLHLLYTRFMYKVLVDQGYIDVSQGDEPFPKFFAHGLIVKDGAKMSKSKGNVVIPDQYIKKFGADTLRTYLMFLGPFSEGGDFRDTGIEGMYRFLKRVWVMATGKTITSRLLSSSANAVLHKTIKGVTNDIKTFHYNTAIAKIMTLYNALAQEEEINRDALKVFLQLLAPFAPHMTEELWEKLNFAKSEEQRVATSNQQSVQWSIHTSQWPEYDESALVEDEVTIVVQVNGKLRDNLRVSKDIIGDQKYIENQAKESDTLKRHLEGKAVKKVIYVPGKILNFVVA